MNGGTIPVLFARGRSLAQAWEQSLVVLWDYGREIRTEYDRKDKDGNFIDPPSKDCSMTFVVEDPAAEPRFHRCFPGGPADLQEYRMEVLHGIKDSWVDLSDKKKWQYTYHGRLTKYQLPGVRELTPLEEPDENQRVRLVGPGLTPCIPRRSFPQINQINKMIEHLARSPYTRRCQAITWQPWEDMDSSDPPCLQRIWCRIMIDENGEWWLNMNVSFRSRDGYMAAFMNADAFICLMQYIATEVGRIAGREVHLGRYYDHSDSYHIYGKDTARFEREFLEQLHTRPFEERTYTSDFLMPMLLEATDGILEKVRKQDLGK